MYGFKKRAGKPQQQSLANGGQVRGPGTGTSDDVKDAVPPGTYIMPADSTRAMGAENLAGLGFHPKARAMAPQGEGPKLGFKPGGKVPVNLSNGEYKISPEQVQAIGAQVLDGLKAATHASAEQQEQEDTGEAAQPERSRDELYFADGGTVRKPPPVDIAQGLREAVIDPIVSDVRQGNRVLQQEYPLAYQAAQLHPVVGIPAAGLNYADAMQKGDTQGAIAASLSSIPLAEKAYKVGNAIASGAREIVGNRGFRAAANNLGRRFGAGEQTAESFEAGQQQGQQMVKPNGLNFANGGLVEDERMRRTSTGKIPLENLPTQDPGRTSSGSIGGQDLPYKDMQRASFGKIGDQPIPNDAFGDLAKPAQAPAGATAKPVGFVAGAFPNTSMAIQSSFDSVRDAQKVGGAGAAVGQGFRSAMTPAIGFADDVATSAKRLLDGPAQALKTFATGDATPIGQDVVAAPAKPTPAAPAIPGTPAAAAASNPIDKPSATAPAVASPAASAATAAQTTAAPSNNVTREGNSFSGQNIGAGFTINGQQPRTGGYVAPAEYGAAPASDGGRGFQPASLRGGGSSPDVMGILQRESQIRQSMAGLQDQVAFNEGTGGSFRKTTNEEIVRDMLVNGNSRDRASALGFMAGNRDAAQRGTQTEQELALRQQDLQGRQGIANEDLGLRREAQGFQTAAQRQVQALQQQYIAEADPAKKTEIERSIRLLSGQTAPKAPFQIATAEEPVDPTRPELGMRKTPYVVDPGTGQGRPVVQPKAAAPSIEQFSAQIRAKNRGLTISDAQLKDAYAMQFGGA